MSNAVAEKFRPGGLTGEGGVTLRTPSGPVSVTLSSAFEPIHRPWLELQASAACSYSQNYHWAEAWQRIVAGPKGSSTALIHGTAASGETLFILPFEHSRIMGQKIIRFIGQDHANYNSGLFRDSFARQIKRGHVDALLCIAADLMGGADAAIFEHQPRLLGDTLNPFALLPQSPSANSGYAMSLDNDFGALYASRISKRRRTDLARRERRLADMGPVELMDAHNDAEAAQILDVCFAQKRDRFIAKGIEDSFAERCYRDFYKAMAAPDDMPEDGKLRVSCLKVAGEIVATRCRVPFKTRNYDILSSISSGPVQTDSPGQVVIRRQVEQACADGYTFEDFGTGSAPHKDVWCDVEIELFDSNLPLSPKGHALCAYQALKNCSKRLIKTTPVLWNAYQAARKQLRGPQ